MKHIVDFVSLDRLGFVVVSLCGITLLFTYPTIFQLSTHLMYSHPDAWQFVWNNFNFREQITHGRDPFFTDYMFHPIGSSLLLHVYCEFNNAVGLLLSPFFNDIATTNLLLLLATVLTGTGMYILAKELRFSGEAAFFAAIAFAFTPFRMSRMTYVSDWAVTQWLPFSFWAFLRMAERQKLRYAFLTGLFFALNFYANKYFAVYLILALIFVLPYGLLRFPNWRSQTFVKNLLVAGAFALLLLSPIAIRFLRDYQEGGASRYHGASTQKSATLSEYFQRGPGNQLGPRFVETHFASSDLTPGWTVLALGLVGSLLATRSRQHNLIMLLLMGLVFLILSLGPELYFGQWTIFMPYAILRITPFLDHVRVPERCVLMTTLSMVLAASYLFFLLRQKFSKTSGRAMSVGVFLALLLELCPIPIPMKFFDPPQIFYAFGQNDRGVMLTVPLYSGTTAASEYLSFQTVHRQKVIEGRIARHLDPQWTYFRNIPILASINDISHARRISRDTIELDRQFAPLFRSLFQPDYLTIYPPFSTRQPVLRYVLTLFPDATLAADQKGIKVFRLPRVRMTSLTLEDADPRVVYFLLSNWRIENSNTSTRIVSYHNNALLLLPEVEAQEILRLRFNVKSNHLTEARLSAGGKVLKEVVLQKQPQVLILDIPGNLVHDAHRILKIQLASHTSEKPQKSLEPKIEIGSIRMDIIS